MKRYIRTSDSTLETTIKKWRAEIQRRIDAREIPENNSIIHTSGYDGDYYWEVRRHDDDADLEDYITEGRDIDDYLFNATFLLELPDDPFGGMAYGDVIGSPEDWEYSSMKEAEAANFGHNDYM